MRSKSFNWRNDKSTGQVNPAPMPANQDEPAQRIEKRYTDLLYVGPRTEDGVLLFHESVSTYNLKWEKLRRWLIGEFGRDERVHFEARNLGLQDRFYFNIPRLLTDTDKARIERMRDKNKADLDRMNNRRSHSPDKKR